MRQAQITVYLPADLLARLDRMVAQRALKAIDTGGMKRRGGFRSDVVRDALLAYLPPPEAPPLSPAVDGALGS